MTIEQTESGNPQRLDKRKLLITGAASGIGFATASLARQAGAAVVLLDRDAEKLHVATRSISGHAIVADLSNHAAIAAAVQEAEQVLGGIDGVINCAGVSPGGRLESLDLEAWNAAIAVNLTAPYLICRLALPALLRHGGTIVNVASGMGLLPDVPGVSAYAASKGGLIAFTKALAAELAPAIRANVVCPGLTETPMAAPLLSPDIKKLALARYAMRRPATPEEIGRAILFLTSEASSFITGTALAVDGGRTFH